MVFEFETPGLPPPRFTFSTGVFGEGSLRSPEYERWEGAPERLILAFYQTRSLKMCWKIVEGTSESRREKSLHKPIQRCELDWDIVI